MPDDRPGLRTSHANRDRVLDALRVAAGDGQLSAEELCTRLESAPSARTLGELAELTPDLPIAPAAKGIDVLVVERHGGRHVREGRLFIASSPGIVIDTDGLSLTYSKLKLRSSNAARGGNRSAARSGRPQRVGCVWCPRVADLSWWPAAHARNDYRRDIPG